MRLSIVFLSAAALFSTAALATAEIHLQEDFSSDWPPTDWSIDYHAGNWSANESNNAGAEAPEARFNWSPQFSGQSRLISPEIDLSGNEMLTLCFLHHLDHYGGVYEIGVATRSGDSAWNSIWSMVNPSGNVTEAVMVAVDNDDISAPDFQICWYFSGNSYNLDYWYLDDILLYTPQEHDVAVSAVHIDSQYEPGAIAIPGATIFNNGLNSETFDVVCEIFSYTGEPLYYASNTIDDLAPGETVELQFTYYTLEIPDELYQVTVTTMLEGDLEPGNDSGDAWTNTYTTPREEVILEIGTGTWCQYCPGAAMGAEDLVDNGHQVGVVEYHSGDSYENGYAGDRIDYYGISGFPTAVFDGVVYVVGGSHDQSMYSTYLPIYNSRIVINSAFSMDITGGINRDDDYAVQVHITRHAPVRSDEMVLHLALTESGIPENWQGQDHLDYVERLMTPDAEGTALDLANEEEWELEFTVNSNWVTEECELVAFIQDLTTKEVQQGIKIMLTELDTQSASGSPQLPRSTSLGTNYPNPFNPSTSITYTLARPGSVSLTVYNTLGELMATLVNEEQTGGTYNVAFDAGNLPSGIYIYRLTAPGYSESSKMMLVK